MPWREGMPTWLERECLSPHPHPLVGASCPATALAHPLPADPSLSAAPHPAQLPLLHPSGCWSGPWAPWLVSLQSWGWFHGAPALPQAPCPCSGAAHFLPHSLVIAFLLPLHRNMNGLPVWPVGHPGAPPHPRGPSTESAPTLFPGWVQEG